MPIPTRPTRRRSSTGGFSTTDLSNAVWERLLDSTGCLADPPLDLRRLGPEFEGSLNQIDRNQKGPEEFRRNPLLYKALQSAKMGKTHVHRSIIPPRPIEIRFDAEVGATHIG